MLTSFMLALSLTSHPLQNPPADEAPSVSRIYDARGALPVVGSSEHSLVLLPLSCDYSDSYGSRGIEPTLDTSTLTSFLRALDPPQWEYPLRELSLDEEYRLTVLAPTTLQDVVARSLVFLEDTLSRPTTILVDIVTFGPNPGVATLPPLMPAAEVSRWTSLGSGHESYELTLRPGERCTQRAERSIDFAIDAEPFVAERAGGYTIRPERIKVGTALDCSVAPAKNGTWLAFALRIGRLIDPDGTHGVNLLAAATHDQGIEYVEGAKLRSDPRLANHSLAINAFLPEGKALAYVTAAGLESRVVFIRQAGALAPTIVNLPEDLKRVSGRSATTLVRMDAVNVPYTTTAQTDERLNPVELESKLSLSNSSPSLVAYASASSRVSTMDHLQKFTDDYELLEMGPFMVLFGSKREVIDQTVTRFTDLAPAPQLIAVTVTLRRGSRDAAALARAVLPIRIGSSSTVVLGRESLYDMLIKGDIAQGLVAMDTVVGRSFDGMVVTLAPHITVSGALSLDIDAHGRWSRTAPRDFELGGKTSPRIQLPDADLLHARRTHVLPKPDSGPRKFTLGNAGTSSEALTLDFEVVDLR